MERIYPDCFQETLENGLRVIAQRVPTSKSVSLGIWFNSGSRDEKKEENGVTHMIEHLIFRGTENYDSYAISSKVDSLGGRINGGTGREYMVIYMDLLPAGLEEGVKLLGDMATAPLFQREHLEMERKVIIEEICSTRDDHRSEAIRMFQEALWGERNGLSLRITGTERSVRTLDRGKLLRRFTQMAGSKNIVLAAAGDLELESLLSYARDYVGDLVDPSGEDEDRLTPTACSQSKSLNRDINQVHCCLGTEGLEKGHEKRYVLEIMNVLLGNGMSSRLFCKIRKKRGLAYSVASETEYFSDTGAFLVYGALDRDNLQEFCALVTEELRKLKEEPVGEKELNLAKRKTKGNLVLGLESNQALMARIGGSRIYEERLEPVGEVLDQIDAVSAEEIRKLANRLLNDELSISLLGPDVSGMEERLDIDV